MDEPARQLGPYDREDDDERPLSPYERAARLSRGEGQPEESDDAETTPDNVADLDAERAKRRPVASPDDLKANDGNAPSSATDAGGLTEAAALSGATNPAGWEFNAATGGAPNLLLLFKNKKFIGGGIVSAIIVIFFTIFSFSVGPFQFIHMAQLLERFHLTSPEDQGNSRILKLYKYSRNRSAGTVQNTRLNVIGRRIADKIDVRMKEIGVEKHFNPGNLGTYEGTSIDPVKFSENSQSGREFSGLNKEEFVQKFKQKFGVDLTIQSDGTILSSSDNGFFAYFKNRSLNLALAEEAGFDKVSGSISTRIMGQRDHVTWHPLHAIDSRLVGSVDQKLSKWYSIMKERIKNGKTGGVGATGAPGKDKANTAGNDTAAQSAETAADDAAKSLDETGNPENLSGPLKELTTSTGGKVALGATAAVGLLCAAKGISDQADALKHNLVILPMIRMAMQAISVGNQVMNGHDVSTEQLGFLSKQLFSPAAGSWASAKSIQAEEGQPQTGPDIPDGANIKKIADGKNNSMFSDVINSIPGLAQVCDVQESVIGQVINIAISLTTPVSSAITYGITTSPVFRDALKSLIGWLAGSPLPAVAFGADYGNYINYGARLASVDTGVALGGTKLSNTQSAELKAGQQTAQRQEFAQKPFLEKVFDPYSPDTLVSKAIDAGSPTINGNVALMINTITNPFKSLASLLSPFSKKASAAATPYDYGFPEVGFSLDTLNSPTYEDPYVNADAAIKTLNLPCKDANGKEIHPCGQDYIDSAKQCFGVTLSPDANTAIDSGLNISVDTQDKAYDDINIHGIKCADSRVAWTQIRMYILDSKTAESQDCYYSGDATSCQAVGFSGSATTTPAVPSGFSLGKYTTMTHDQLVDLILGAPNWKPQNSGPTNDIKNGIAKDDLLRLIAALLEALPSENITASYIRTGHDCRTTNGNISNHMGGLALDIGGAGQTEASMNNMYGWLYQNAAALNINELIHDPVPTGMSTLRQGQPFTYDATTLKEHQNHIHVSVKGPQPTSCPNVHGPQ